MYILDGNGIGYRRFEMARELWPINGRNIGEMFPNVATYVTEEQFQELAAQVNLIADSIQNVDDDLQSYKAQLTDGITSAVGNITTLNSEQINAVAAEITNAVINSIDASYIDTTNLNATNASINTLNSNAITTDGVAVVDKATLNDVEANTIKTNSLETDTLVVNGTQTFDNININSANITDATAENLDATEADIQQANINSVTGYSISVNGNVTSPTANLTDIENTKIETEYITHDTEFYEINVAGANSWIVVELPRFINGVAQVCITDEHMDPYVTVEAHNSTNNYMVKYNSRIHYLNRICFFDNNEEVSQCYLHISTHGSNLRMYYKIDSLECTDAPQIYEEQWPVPTTVSGFKAYDVSDHLSATLFNRPTISASGTSDVSSLTLASSELYGNRTVEPTVYDTTAAKTRIIYTPDQNVNSTEGVKFLSVDAPFLNVADMEIANKLKTPNIYNGITLSAQEVAALPDETLYIPIGGGTSGTINSGIAIYSATLPALKTDTPTIGEQIRYFSSSLSNAVAGHTFIMDEYKPQDGYELTVVSMQPEYSIFSPSVPRGFQTTLVFNNTTGEYYIIKPNNRALFQEWYAAKLEDIQNNGRTLGYNWSPVCYGIYTDDSMTSTPTWSKWNENTPGIYIFGDVPAPNEVFYVGQSNDETYLPIGYYTVVYPNIVLETLGQIDYTRTGGAGSTATINRKTTKNGNVQVAPLVPYIELES